MSYNFSVPGVNRYIPYQYMGLGIEPMSSAVSGYPVSPLQSIDHGEQENRVPMLYCFQHHKGTVDNYEPLSRYPRQSIPQDPKILQQKIYDFEGYSPDFIPQSNSLPHSNGKTHKKTKSLPTKINSQSYMNKFSSVSPQNNTTHKFKSSGSISSVGSVLSDSVLSSKVEYPIHKLSKSAVTNDDIYEKLKKNVYPVIEVKKYSTSAIDPIRNYLTVFEYSINNQWIIWDYETGFVHLTGIWKASLSANDYISNPNIKADIVKLLESTPKKYHELIKRIRGGFLKIQGTWLPYNLCRMLARRFSYYIRFALIPIFGIDFPDYCLHPSDPRFGELKLDDVNDDNIDEMRINTAKKASIANHRKSHSTSSLNTSRVGGKMKKTNKVGKEKNIRISSTESPEQKFKFPEVQTPVFRSSKFLPPPISCPTKLQIPAKDNIAYRDMVDIVNASKCLQSLSKSNSTTNSYQASPISLNFESTTSTSPHPNYIATSDQFHNDHSNGISSILIAAGLSESSTNSSSSILDKPIPKASMKIDDLLS